LEINKRVKPAEKCPVSIVPHVCCQARAQVASFNCPRDPVLSQRTHSEPQSYSSMQSLRLSNRFRYCSDRDSRESSGPGPSLTGMRPSSRVLLLILSIILCLEPVIKKQISPGLIKKSSGGSDVPVAVCSNRGISRVRATMRGQ
jgi:hypothetical protein